MMRSLAKGSNLGVGLLLGVHREMKPDLVVEIALVRVAPDPYTETVPKSVES